jgi:diketogulonate reductase-like aldo/keto reductase
MTSNSIKIDGCQLPTFLYGTAWKEDETRRLTELALQTGFRGIDTANQRRHYHEAAVGEAVAAAIAAGIVKRADLFLQTKFTFRPSQDHRLPYNPDAPIASQVAQSFASSLEHLAVESIDSYLLHGPTQRIGISAADWSAWQAMEEIHDSGRTRWLGISNISLEQLQLFCERARIPPRFVQNRCYAVRSWDRDIRKFCSANKIIYQGFSLLTANRDALAQPILARIAKNHGRTVSQIVFRFALDIGLLPLTGTTSPIHMQSDLDVTSFQLSPEEVDSIENIIAR